MTFADSIFRDAEPRSRRIAFLTMDCLDDFVCYDHMAIVPLNQRGWTVEEVSWRRDKARWDDFIAVVIRSPWDYHHDLGAFMALLETIERSQAQLMNPLDVVKWNIDKTYLRGLESGGVRIVPTRWATTPTENDLQQAIRRFQCGELVVKPTVGAGATDTFRWRPDGPSDRTDEIVARYRDRPAMLQPFVTSITAGEISLFYFGGRFSHAILKIPKPGDFRVQEEYGSELRAIDPTVEQLQLAELALQNISTDLLYARVDLVALAEGEHAVIELELIEPSLYFPFDDESPHRFARVLDEMLRRS